MPQVAESNPVQPEKQRPLNVDRDPVASPDGDVTAPPQPNQAPSAIGRDNGKYTLQRNVDEVVLNATVLDDNHRLVNDLTKEPVRPRAAVETLLLLLSPLAPHIAEELWKQLGHAKTLAYEQWPVADPKYLAKTEVEMPVQLNGKLKGLIKVPPKSTQEVVIAAAKELPGFAEWTAGKTIKKVVVVPDKLINFVVV